MLICLPLFPPLLRARFVNHQNSAKLEAVTRVKAEAKMDQLREQLGSAAGQWGVQFVQQGTDEAIACRTLLKWTYVLAHAVPDSAPAKERFLYLQRDLESKTERLSELLESEAEKLLEPAVRREILALVGILAQTRRNVLGGIDDELVELEAQGAAGAAGAGGASGSGAGGGAEGSASAAARGGGAKEAAGTGTSSG